MTENVLIIDFGSQVTQLIARRVREAGVYSEIVPFNKAHEALERLKPRAVILSGGPASVTEMGTPRAPDWVFETGLPVLGICYGEQTMVEQLGGGVEGSDHREFGRAELEVTKASALFDGVWVPGDKPQVWMSHGDRVTKLPEGFEVTAVSAGAPFAAIADEKRKLYAVQFILRSFTRRMGQCCSIISCTKSLVSLATGRWLISGLPKLSGSGRRSEQKKSSAGSQGALILRLRLC